MATLSCLPSDLSKLGMSDPGAVIRLRGTGGRVLLTATGSSAIDTRMAALRTVGQRQAAARFPGLPDVLVVHESCGALTGTPQEFECDCTERSVHRVQPTCSVEVEQLDRTAMTHAFSNSQAVSLIGGGRTRSARRAIPASTALTVL